MPLEVAGQDLCDGGVVGVVDGGLGLEFGDGGVDSALQYCGVVAQPGRVERQREVRLSKDCALNYEGSHGDRHLGFALLLPGASPQDCQLAVDDEGVASVVDAVEVWLEFLRD